MNKSIPSFLAIIYLLIFYLTVVNSVHANPIEKVDREFRGAIKQIEKIKADNHLSFKEKHPIISSLFWQTIKSSENTSTSKIYLTSYDGFSKNIQDLLFEIIPFYLNENRAYLAKDIIQYGIDYTKNNSFISEHIKLLTIMGDMYSSIGLFEQCRTLSDNGTNFFQEETLFLGLDNKSMDAFNLEYKFSKQQLFLLKLKCDDFNSTSNTEDISFWLNAWPKIKGLYQNDFLIPFVMPDFVLSQYTLLAGIKKRNLTEYLQFQPKNIDLLYELFKYFCRVNKNKEAGEVRNILLQWLEHNSNIDENHKLWRKATGEMLRIPLEYMSETEIELVKTRFLRAKFLSYYYRESVNSQWYLLKKNKKLSNHSSANLLQQLNIIEDKYEKYFTNSVKDADEINSKKLHARSLRAFYLEMSQEFEQAANLFDKNIEWAEVNREQIPVEQRKYFFRSYLRESYVGAYRNRAFSLKKQPRSTSRLALFLGAGDKLRSRELKDKRGIEASDTSYSLNENQALFISADLSTHILSFWQNNKGIFIDVIHKPVDWEKNIYKLREQIVSQQNINKELFKFITEPLIAPFKQSLTEAQNIYPLIDGALSLLPMSYLLLDKFDNTSPSKTIQYIANLNHIGVKQEVMPLKNTSFLAIADPTYNQQASLDFIYQNNLPNLSKTRANSLQGSFMPLPETRVEVKTIAAMISGEKKLLLGRQASKEVFIEEVSNNYQIIHFATHGIIGGELPGIKEPALVLTPNIHNDGLLLASEIEGLSLNADLVVLSACNTGSGEYFYGEELQGLAKAFALAGTKNLLVSLWPVDSESTVRVMVAFYKYLSDGKSVEYALVEAQQDVFNNKVDDSSMTRGLKRISSDMEQEQSKHPYYWAPFILIKAN